jgi:quinol monooxygenase YgiN
VSGPKRELHPEPADRSQAQSTIVFAAFTALPGKADEVQALVQALTPQVRSETGNELFIAHQKTSAPEEFVIYERYTDEAAFRAHLSYEHGREFNAHLRPLIEGDVVVELLDQLREPE